MTQPPKGPGALPLLLRLSMVRSRQRGGGSLAERGYALAVALIAAFVLLLGVGALASRSQLGFVGQVFQVQNRQARDVAEAAIAEFGNTLNQERNRHLLIAGTTDNWDSSRWATPESDFRNICTAFTNDLTPINAAVPAFTVPDPAAITRFALNASRDLVPGQPGRGQFTVESIEFLNESRQPYVDAAGNSLNFTDPNPPNDVTPFLELYRTGARRSLIRISVVGSVAQPSGRTSTARVAREFEVVPKCCKRSFGQNVFGGRNWGRDKVDDEACGGPLQNDVSGLIAGMNGGQAGGSNNIKQIIQEDGSLVTEAACWAGNDPLEPSVLNGTPNSTCTAGTSSLANISFLPRQFSFNPPVYNHPGGNPAAPNVQVNSKYDYLYFDPVRFADALNNGGQATSAVPNAWSGIVLRSGSNFRRIDGTALNNAALDPCYIRNLPDPASGRPYYDINCRVQSINPSGNSTLYIDTTLAKINIFFTGTGDVGIGSGNAGTYRIHGNSTGLFRSSLSDPLPTAPSTCVGATSDAGVGPCLIRWPNVTPGTPITQALRLNTFLELCADRGGYNCDTTGDNEEDFSVRRLLNFYSSANNRFIINGGSTGVGYNIYAPFGDVRVNGGGNSDNIMGQIWTNNLTLNGGVRLRTFNGSGGQASGAGTGGFAFGRALIDFVARSFTQSSGFGL